MWIYVGERSLENKHDYCHLVVVGGLQGGSLELRGRKNALQVRIHVVVTPAAVTNRKVSSGRLGW